MAERHRPSCGTACLTAPDRSRPAHEGMIVARASPLPRTASADDAQGQARGAATLHERAAISCQSTWLATALASGLGMPRRASCAIRHWCTGLLVVLNGLRAGGRLRRLHSFVSPCLPDRLLRFYDRAGEGHSHRCQPPYLPAATWPTGTAASRHALAPPTAIAAGDSGTEGPRPIGLHQAGAGHWRAAHRCQRDPGAHAGLQSPNCC